MTPQEIYAINSLTGEPLELVANVTSVLPKIIKSVNESGWISVEEKWPKYGEPILVVINGVVQKVTYCRDGSDDSEDWCEPFHFDHEDCCKRWWSDVTHWMPLPQPPKAQGDEDE